MEWQTLADVGAACIMAVIGWFARQLWYAVDGLKMDVAKLREELPKTYVAKDDFTDFRRDLMTILARIETKIDAKQDK